MGPELLLASTLATAGSTLIGAAGQASSMRSQAAADRQRAAYEGEWATQRANEERASGQSAAGIEMRKAQLAQSKLTTLAGASGGGAADPTVLKLMGDIETEGRVNAGMATAGAEQKAAGIEHQSAVDQWVADTNARIKNSTANTTLIGGILGAAGGAGQSYYKSRMGARYGGDPQQSYAYG